MTFTPEKEITVTLNVASFGQWLAVKRMGLRLSQEEVAEVLGISRQAVSTWENGKVIPKMNSDQAEYLCNLFQCSLKELPKQGVKIVQIVRPKDSQQGDRGTKRVVKSKK